MPVTAHIVGQAIEWQHQHAFITSQELANQLPGTGQLGR